MKSLPKGSWARLRAGAKVGRAIAHSGMLRLGKGKEAAAAALGETLLDELDQLKGMAMKVGQILSYMDVGLPEKTREKLERLQAGCKGVEYEVMKKVVEDSFGQPLEELFDAFELTPVAAASIGQVHRARVGGHEVAVKVRYPGIEQTIQQDMKHLHRFGKLAGLATNVDGAALVRELQTRVLDECDYTREARWQRAFAGIFVNDPEIRVVRPEKELSSPDVLTTEWIDGLDFQALKAQPQDVRDDVAAALLRFTLEPLFQHRMLQADPHPGNFVYSPSGASIAALDFGCVRVFDAPTIDALQDLICALQSEEHTGFRDTVHRLGLTPEPSKIDFDNLWRMMSWMFAPYVTQGRFAFSRQWWSEGQTYTNVGNRNARVQGFPPEWLWINRTIWGLHAVLVQIDARVDAYNIMRDALNPVIASQRTTPPDRLRQA